MTLTRTDLFALICLVNNAYHNAIDEITQIECSTYTPEEIQSMHADVDYYTELKKKLVTLLEEAKSSR